MNCGISLSTIRAAKYSSLHLCKDYCHEVTTVTPGNATSDFIFLSQKCHLSLPGQRYHSAFSQRYGMEDGRVVGKLEHFQNSKPLNSVLCFGRQPDSYRSSIMKNILKKLVTMNATTKILSVIF